MNRPIATPRSFATAARIAVGNSRPTFVFDGPDGGYVVTDARLARELRGEGMESYSLGDLCRAIKAEQDARDAEYWAAQAGA